MVLPFGESNLFEIALNKIKSSSLIPWKNFYVSICEEELLNIAKKYETNVFLRSEESANNDNDLKKIYEWHDKLPYKFVVKINACSPLLSIESIDKFVLDFINQKEENLFGVIETKDYYWNKQGELTTPWPADQTIMNTKAVEVTYRAAHVLYASRMDLISKDMFMGNFKKRGGIKLHPMPELECFDIDYPWQFKVAEALYESGV